MAERSDLSGTSFHVHDELGGPTATALVCHDSHPGGLGYAATAYEHLDQILDAAIGLVEGCRCGRGCPACVGSWARDPRRVAWSLRRLREEVPVPAELVTAGATPVAARPPCAARIPWLQISERWDELVTRLRGARVTGAELLGGLRGERHGLRLVLRVPSPGLAGWLASDAARRQLWQAIAAQVDVPGDGAIAVEHAGEGTGDRERSLRTAHKLQRRHDDLVGGRPETERAANARLAGGYVLPGAGARRGPPRRAPGGSPPSTGSMRRSARPWSPPIGSRWCGPTWAAARPPCWSTSWSTSTWSRVCRSIRSRSSPSPPRRPPSCTPASTRWSDAPPGTTSAG
jgi:hypothetical protein